MSSLRHCQLYCHLTQLTATSCVPIVLCRPFFNLPCLMASNPFLYVYPLNTHLMVDYMIYILCICPTQPNVYVPTVRSVCLRWIHVVERRVTIWGMYVKCGLWVIVHDFAFLVRANEIIEFWYLFVNPIIKFVSVSWRFYCTSWWST